MPEAERRRILPSHVEPATPGDDVVVQNQAEGVDAVDPEALARARAAVGAEDSALEIGIDLPVTPEEEKVAPGYGAYVQRAWDYVKGYLMPTVEDPIKKKVYTEAEQVQRQQRRDLFKTVDHITGKLINAETPDVRKLIGQELKVRTNSYRILRLLGNGGMGIVLVVENIQQPGKEYVMKLGHSFDRSVLSRDTEEMIPGVKNPNFLQRIFGLDEPRPLWDQAEKDNTAEARRQVVEVASLYKLTRTGENHTTIERSEDGPVIPQLIDAQFIPHPDNSERRLSAVVMEKIEGDQLYNKLQENTGLDNTDEIIDYSQKLMDGVQYIHQAGVLHLDLKPENIIVTSDKRLAFVDFGLSDVDKRKKDNTRPLYATKVPNTIEQTGTKGYFVSGEPLGTSRDSFGTGRIILDMVYGTAVARDIDERIQHFQSLKPALQRIARVAEKLVTRDQKNRATLQQARALLDAELEKAVQ